MKNDDIFTNYLYFGEMKGFMKHVVVYNLEQEKLKSDGASLALEKAKELQKDREDSHKVENIKVKNKNGIEKEMEIDNQAT